MLRTCTYFVKMLLIYRQFSVKHLVETFSSRFCIAKIRLGNFNQPVRRIFIMNIGILIIMIIGGVAGIASTLYLLISLPVVILQKIYRKVRYGTPLTM